MQIYIPSHLRSLTIFEQMAQLISQYSADYVDDGTSYDDYYETILLSPVKKFISLCVTSDKLDSSQDLENVINYLEKLFYSTKGSVRLFDYLQTYLGLDLSGGYSYTTEYIDLTITGLDVTDETLFNEYFDGFLNDLLYFKDYQVTTDSMTIRLTGTLSFSANNEVSGYYKKHSPERISMGDIIWGE